MGAPKNNLNRLAHGKRSPRIQRILQGLLPARCDLCDFAACPHRIESAPSVCALHPALCAMGDNLLDHSPEGIAGYLENKIAIDTARYLRAVAVERADDMGLDPEIARLSAGINRDLKLLHQIVDPTAGRVLIDNRRQTLSIEVQQAAQALTEEEQQRALQAIIDLRALPEGDRLANELLAGRDPAQLAAVIVDGEVVDDGR